MEDAEFSSQSAVKAKKTMELELADLQQQIDELFKSKQEVTLFSHVLMFLTINQGPVVQSVVSLLRVISLTVLADSIHSILIFFAEKM